MNEIKLRQSKVNYLELINLNLNRQEWGKTYVLYTYGKITVTCEMTSFDFRRQEANFEIITSFADNNNIHRRRYCWLHYTINNFSENQFKNYVINNIISKIKSELDYIKNEEAKEKFADLQYDDEDNSNETILKDAGMSEDYDAICDLDNADRLLEVLVEKALEKLNEEFEREVEDYCENVENDVVIEEVNEFLEILKDEVNYD